MSALLSAADLRSALLAALDALREARAAIDAANVFPVPDGDTGTNMVMTFEACADRLREAGDTSSAIADAITGGAMAGARGNAGVISAQILRAWAGMVRNGPADAEVVASGFSRATELAYEAVLHPAEGTILSVMRAAADAANAEKGSIAGRFAAAALAGAEELARSPERMQLLADEGVVDAGGMGLVAVLFAMARALGADLPDQPPREIVRAKLSGRPQQLTYPIEVQYMLRVGDERIGDVRRELGDIGDSVTVIGGAGEWRVHVHTDVQDEAIAIGRRAGDVDGIEIVDLAEQIAARRGWRGIEMARADDAARLIAVADGEGARALFRELGAVAVAPAELPSAIEAGSGKPFIVLANGKEAARAARASANGSGIEVIEARDAAHGLAAAVAYADGRSAAETIADMRGALLSTRSGAADDARSLVSVARDLGGASADALTVLASADVAGAEREAVGAELRRTFPRAEVEVHDGGQSSPRFVVSVEGVSE